MSKGEPLRSRLDRANIELAKELLSVKSSLDVYKLIGLNASRIGRGQTFFGHVQRLSHLYVALGLAKIYEREKRHELCSVPGIYRLAKHVAIQSPSAAMTFAREYGVESCGKWVQDVDHVLSKQQPLLGKHLQVVDKVRNTRIAHLQQDAPVGNLPSIAAFEELLAFAVAFHSFVNEAFLSTGSHPILHDGTMSGSLSTVLKDVGVSNVVRDLTAQSTRRRLRVVLPPHVIEGAG